MYEEIFNEYDKKLNGAILVANQNTTIALNAPFYENSESITFKFFSKQITTGTKIRCTGRFFIDDYDSTYWYQFQLVDGSYCFINSEWMNDYNQWSKEYEDTQKSLNKYLDMDAYILENLLCASEIIVTARKAGITVPVEFNNRLNDLLQRHHKRQSDVMASGLVTDIQVATSTTYPYRNSLLEFNSDPQIGIIPLIAIGIIIVVALVIYTTWDITKDFIEDKWATEARKDVTLSDDLLVDMKNQLSPETFDKFIKGYEALLKRIEELEKKNKKTSITSTLKYAALAFLGIYVFDKFSNRKVQQTNGTN